MTEQYQLRYLVIPAYLYQDNRLSSLELRLAAFINTFKGDRFFFSNEHLATMFNSSERSVSRAIAELTKKALIGVDYEIKAGGGKVRFIRSLIQAELEGLATSGESDSTKVASPIYKEVNGSKLKDIPPTPKGEQCERFIAWFNAITGREYIPTTARAKKLAARLKRYTPEQIARAVQNAMNDPFFSGKKTDFVFTPDFVLRSDENVDRLLNLGKKSSSLGDMRIQL